MGPAGLDRADDRGTGMTGWSCECAASAARAPERSRRGARPTGRQTSGKLPDLQNVLTAGRLEDDLAAPLPRHPVWGGDGSTPFRGPTDPSSRPPSPQLACHVTHDEPYSTEERADHTLTRTIQTPMHSPSRATPVSGPPRYARTVVRCSSQRPPSPCRRKPVLLSWRRH